MSIQVEEGGLPAPPHYEVPQYPNQGFDCHSVSEMVKAVEATGLIIAPTAREYYVENKDRYNAWDRSRTLFSTALFNLQGEEIAVLSHMMNRAQFLAKPNGHGRIWGQHAVDATQANDISYLIGRG